MENETEPKTLQQAIIYFSDPKNCLNYLAARRWPDGVTCPTCGRDDVSFLEKQNKWQCKSAHKQRQFSAKVGTIFEDSPLGLDKWLAAVWMIVNNKNGKSSYEMGKDLGVTQKTAWFMEHRIRLAMQTGSFAKKLSGQVEVDETYIGGKARNIAPFNLSQACESVCHSIHRQKPEYRQSRCDGFIGAQRRSSDNASLEH